MIVPRIVFMCALCEGCCQLLWCVCMSSCEKQNNYHLKIFSVSTKTWTFSVFPKLSNGKYFVWRTYELWGSGMLNDSNRELSTPRGAPSGEGTGALPLVAWDSSDWSTSGQGCGLRVCSCLLSRLPTAHSSQHCESKPSAKQLVI